jgi:hypothetical protein
MRGSDEWTGSLFSVTDLEARVPQRHPLRKTRKSWTTRSVTSMENFLRSTCPMTAVDRAQETAAGPLLQVFFSVHSERQADGADR